CFPEVDRDIHGGKISYFHFQLFSKVAEDGARYGGWPRLQECRCLSHGSIHGCRGLILHLSLDNDSVADVRNAYERRDYRYLLQGWPRCKKSHVPCSDGSSLPE